MVSWLGKRLIGYTMSRTRQGDIGPTVRLYAPDVTFTFPGDSSWAGTMRGKREVADWLRRLALVGLQVHPDEVVLKGFPWRMTVCIRGHDYLKSPEGETVYENRYVIWGRMAWGRLKEYELYEDTIKSRGLDAYLAAREPSLMPA